ncbi:unnamed protein product (macronuclear) [Paramecium tetraurelia]|uniref:Uncharacterized protein n=1 Tax=Paramecium tetraurelia TaxID=5888 RepID=A0ECN6_PARTE|nr:uncharacterized protein GSPATT00003922001 [Paramecium tetraurelia]CAK93053.1 unnamed protein product [Paramecium tetraurelia]|eukprot:XP_001460450.1 hypothetical protein (macronuclear) [Paramecium tetraurelia strain d4-2]
MKHNIFILILLCLANTLEQWDIIYQSFQDTNTMDTSGWILSNNYNGLTFSTCAGSRLYGGYNLFGANTILSKLFSLPPHYKINLTFEFWKIDSWDAEYVYMFVDDKSFTKVYQFWEGDSLCGMSTEKDLVEIITFNMNHTLESLIILITSNLNQPPTDESWGIRDFTLSIVKCPSGCLYCSDDIFDNCYYWIWFLSLWQSSIALNGWIKNVNSSPIPSKCVSFDIAGGQFYLAPGDKLEKTIPNLSPHYTIQINLQLFKIDTWNNENFELLVDDQIYNQTVLKSTGVYSICGYTGLERIVNIGITLPHSSSSCKITMRTNQYSASVSAYWGIRAFTLYLAKCCNGCDQCLGPLKTDCTHCSSGWITYNNLCINSPFYLLSQVLINQVQDPHSDERIPIEINILETNQQIVTQGTFTYSINNSQKILNFRIYVKCYANKKFQSYFIKCFQCQSQIEQQFSDVCYGANTFIIYNARFQVSEQDLIINTSNTECSIYQVATAANESVQIKILEILQQNV